MYRTQCVSVSLALLKRNSQQTSLTIKWFKEIAKCTKNIVTGKSVKYYERFINTSQTLTLHKKIWVSFLHDIKERSQTNRKQTHLRRQQCSVPSWSQSSTLHPGWGGQAGHWGAGFTTLSFLHSLFRPAHVHLWPCSHVPETTVTSSVQPKTYKRGKTIQTIRGWWWFTWIF